MTNPILKSAVEYKEPNSLEDYNFAIQQNELKLGFHCYNYGARLYDPAIGRFHSLDPLSEKYASQSTLAYAANNPIRYVDLMGLGPDDINDVLASMDKKQGYVVYVDNETGVTTITKTEASYHQDKLSSNSVANIVMTETMFTMDGDGNTVSVITTETEINATFTAEQDELFNSREVADVKTKQNSSKAVGAKYDQDKVNDLTNSDPIASGVSSLIKSPRGNEIFSGSMSLPGLTGLAKVEKFIEILAELRGTTFGIPTNLSNITKLEIPLKEAGSAYARFINIAYDNTYH